MHARFPLAGRPRLWGVAVSHYQVEGSDPCDWSEWEANGRTRGGVCETAIDSWRLYEHDAALARAAGSNAFRFSVSWSRVEPRRGVFDDRVLERYSRFVDELLKLDIEPIVTLFHYTHPLWFHDATPWTSTESVQVFERFARVVAETFGRRVRVWVPLNEPLVFILAGYYDAQIPPGIADVGAAARALDHLLAAHTAAASVIRSVNPEAAIGIAHNMMTFVPDRLWQPLDSLIAALADRGYNDTIVDAFATGKWSFYIPPFGRLAGRRDDLPASIDFFGVNYYSRLHVQAKLHSRKVADFIYRDMGGGVTDLGWEIAPRALFEVLRRASRVRLPLVITENGLADASDSLRGRFLRDHLATVRDAEAAGIDIAGYLHWSLVDNYEWLDGFGPKFGLYEVDRQTMERRARPSVEIFRSLGESFVAGWR